MAAFISHVDCEPGVCRGGSPDSCPIIDLPAEAPTCQATRTDPLWCVEHEAPLPDDETRAKGCLREQNRCTECGGPIDRFGCTPDECCH